MGLKLFRGKCDKVWLDMVLTIAISFFIRGAMERTENVPIDRRETNWNDLLGMANEDDWAN